MGRRHPVHRTRRDVELRRPWFRSNPSRSVRRRVLRAIDTVRNGCASLSSGSRLSSAGPCTGHRRCSSRESGGDTVHDQRPFRHVCTAPERGEVELQPMAFTNLALDIAPLSETRARMQCATPQPDFDVYYVLPHFHVLGQWLSVDVAGGAMNGTNIFRSQGSFGDSMGRTFDPPVSVVGSSGLVITCDYQNPRSTTVHYGNGDQE